MWLISLFFFIYLVSWNVVTNDRYAVRNTINIYMMITLIFVTVKVNFGYLFNLEIITNLSIVWYSAAIALQIICKMRIGSHFTMNTTIISLKTMIFLQIMIFILSQFPDFIVTNPIYHDFGALARTNINRGATATYASFIIASAAIIIVVKNTKRIFPHPFLTYSLAVVLSQSISSLTYYPIVFGFDYNIIPILVVGTLIKIAMTLAYFPLFYHFKTEVIDHRFNH